MTEHFKRQGLLIDNNIKIKQDIAELAGVESDVPVWISGEVDQLLRKAELDADGNVLSISQTEAVIVDAKTIRGYGAREAMGNKEFRNGKAKDNGKYEGFYSKGAYKRQNCSLRLFSCNLTQATHFRKHKRLYIDADSPAG